MNWSGYNNSFSVSTLPFTSTSILLLAYILKVPLSTTIMLTMLPNMAIPHSETLGGFFLCLFVAFSADSTSRRAQSDQSDALSQSQIRSEQMKSKRD